jgi:hypothetical protein
MSRFRTSACQWTLALLTSLLPAVLHAAGVDPKDVTPAEKIRKALDQVRDLEIADQPLDSAVNQLRQLTNINFAIDPVGIPASPAPLPGKLGVASGYDYLHVGVSAHNVPLREAVTKLLRSASLPSPLAGYSNPNLTYALVGDTVWITTTARVLHLEMEQPVSLNAEKVPLGALLPRLVQRTGANIVLDPRVGKVAREEVVTLRLDDVPLQVAVELLADQADLRVVRLHNVLYVTSEARAEKLLKSHQASALPAASAPTSTFLNPLGAALIGTPGVGMLGVVGMGAMGVGGGVQGNFQGRGAPQPVPLTPPVPKTTPHKEEKSKEPAIKPARKQRKLQEEEPSPHGKKTIRIEEPPAAPQRPLTPRRRSRRWRALAGEAGKA